jgi:hypothetical protein
MIGLEFRLRATPPKTFSRRRIRFLAIAYFIVYEQREFDCDLRLCERRQNDALRP